MKLSIEYEKWSRGLAPYVTSIIMPTQSYSEEVIISFNFWRFQMSISYYVDYNDDDFDENWNKHTWSYYPMTNPFKINRRN